MDMKSVSERLQVIRGEKNIRSVRAFALQLNADPSFFDKIYKGNTDITENILSELQKKFNVNPAWIKFGETPKYFGVPSINVNGPNNAGPPVDEVVKAKDETIAALTRSLNFLEAENARLAKQCEVSLAGLNLTAHEVYAAVRAIMESQGLLRAAAQSTKVDPKKVGAAEEEVRKQYGDYYKESVESKREHR